MRRIIILASLATACPGAASAWGYKGHQVVADIARAELTPAVRAKVDAILAADTDPLTGHDMAAEATWADAYRSNGHRETAQWHFVDTELDHPDINAACFGHPAADTLASSGPARECVIDKVREFAGELVAPGTAAPERLLALKFLLHFVGDLHQPLHASDNHDRGGNCVLLSLGGARTQNLHAYWDKTVVDALGPDPATIAAVLRVRITPAQRALWRGGDAMTWSREAFLVARSTTYAIGSKPGCGDPVSIVLLPAYDAKARAAAALQLERAGVRLAALINHALSGMDVTKPMTGATPAPVAVGSSPRASFSARTPASLRCSTEADQRGLHGKDRRRFRRACISRAG